MEPYHDGNPWELMLDDCKDVPSHDLGTLEMLIYTDHLDENEQVEDGAVRVVEVVDACPPLDEEPVEEQRMAVTPRVLFVEEVYLFH